MLPLRCPAQNYAWGRPATSSEVAKLAEANGSEVDATKPFAELWIGTHPSGPAMVQSAAAAAAQPLTLHAWLQRRPEALGDAVLSRFPGGDLPFLFKVLSVQTALSIQSHPDKKLAERLHRSDPVNYKDDNHKPEMALALEDFEALCGFVTTPQLRHAFRTVPELAQCVEAKAADAVLNGDPSSEKEALRMAFTALMTCESDRVAAAVDAVAARLTAESSSRQLSDVESLALRLNEQYPKDVGVLASFFLNRITLKTGEAVHLGANIPHAYLSGELVECMATSDNVIRAGLTPKFRDTAALCGSLTYEQGLPTVLRGEAVHDHVRAYLPPFDEFEILAIEVPAGTTSPLPVNPGPLLLLAQHGAGNASASGGAVQDDEHLVRNVDLARGSVLFVPAGVQLSVTASAERSLFIWGAACNRRVFAAAKEAAAATPAAEAFVAAV